MLISLTSLTFRSLALLGLAYNLWSISEIFFKFQINTEITVELPRTYEPLDAHFCARFTDLIPRTIKEKKLTEWNKNNETNLIRTLQHNLRLSEIFSLTPSEYSLLQKIEFRLANSYELYSCELEECLKYFSVARFVFMEYLCYRVSLRTGNVSQSVDLIYLAVSPAFSGLSTRIYFRDDFNGIRLFKIALSKPSEYPYTELAVASQRFGDHDLLVGFKSLKSQLLEAPYASDCLNYSSVDLRSRDYCYSQCVYEKTLVQIGKLPFAVMLDQANLTEFIVSYNDIKDATISSKVHLIHSQCMNKCHHSDCYKESITTYVMTMNNPFNSSTFALSLVIPVDPAIDMKTHPKMSTVEFFIFVLSSISTWTSLSILSLDPVKIVRYLSLCTGQVSPSKSCRQSAVRRKRPTRLTQFSECPCRGRCKLLATSTSACSPASVLRYEVPVKSSRHATPLFMRVNN